MGLSTVKLSYFPGGSDGKVSAYTAGDLGSIPVLGRSPGEGNGNPLQPRKSHRWRSLVGYSPWSGKELDTTERLHFQTDSGQGLAEAGGNLEDGAHLQKKGWYV